MSRAVERLVPDLFAITAAAPALPWPAGVPRNICEMFERLALRVKASGIDKYSARALFHQMRWLEHIEKGNREFAVNNIWSADLARWLMAKHPHMTDFFETRESAAYD